ncbi:enoyl-CoA hydratase/isomerase family protein [Curvivirga aplysinae]|uniref:enoyl-CoA hydratase/isomerase family protein n=1 Tax=Curvivirga aplysinae TaxID=2529852 RepID=UPI0012BBC201|nr:enoyl-CoA hydratase/isomerase family protein [Curvivirga aplysinae]MTI09186.1 enoyl-CoA hydratase/isomerase family protein [Curvivirga aplysinae]
MSQFSVTKNGLVARVTLTNADKHNAFDDALITGLTTAFDELAVDDTVRVIVLQSEGKSFSAGADLNWMKRMAAYSHEENFNDAMALAGLLKSINFNPKPVIGKIQGAAFGGGVGLVACCDIAIASEYASFCLSEVKLGLTPATISPYVVAAMGQQAARRYFLTAERFKVEEALRLGLVHEVVSADALDSKVDEIIDTLLKNSPAAMTAGKDLIFAVDRPVTSDVIKDTASRIADIRSSEEGQEGLTSFLEKRKPRWLEDYEGEGA